MYVEQRPSQGCCHVIKQAAFVGLGTAVGLTRRMGLLQTIGGGLSAHEKEDAVYAGGYSCEI